MFYKICVLTGCIFILNACNTNNDAATKNNTGIDTAKINTLFSEKNITAALVDADEQLGGFPAKNDPGEYILYNQWLINKMKLANADRRLLKKYYRNIFLQETSLNQDTAALRSVINAGYNWAEISFQTEDRTDDSVIICLEKAIGLNHTTPALASADESYAYKILGILYNQLGDTKKSLGYYELENHFLNSTHINGVAGNAINRSIALKEIGQPDAAIQLLKNTLAYPAITALKRADMFTILSEVETQKGMTNEAARSIDSALYILDTIKNITPQVNEKTGQAFKQRGILERINKNYAGSLQSQLLALRHNKASGNVEGRDLAKIYLALGESYKGMDQYDSAIQYYQVALQSVVAFDPVDIFSIPLATQLYAENTIMEALDAKADLLQLMYKQKPDANYLEWAIHCYELSFEVERKLMQNFSYDESRLQMLKISKHRSETAISLCYQLLQLTNGNTWKEKAFVFAEKSKAFVLLESIKRNMAANSVLQGNSNFQHIQYLQLRLSFFDKKISELSGIKTDSLRNVFASQQSQLNNELLLANNELSRSNTSYKIITDQDDSISIAITKEKLLDEKTSLVEFFAGDSATYIFSFSKNSDLLFFKAANSIHTNLDTFLFFYTDKNKINNDPAAYQLAAFKLYQELRFTELSKQMSKRLLIIPDGKFNFIPFEALITGINSSNNPQSFSYLLLQKQITYNYSVATVLKQLEFETNSNHSGNTICFAPVFSNHERGNIPLLHSEEELEAVKKNVPNGNYFSKKEASIGHFKKEINNASIVHIASHATADTTEKQQPRIEFYDSTLYLDELYAMHINPNLVVLSACETGVGEINKSEGAMSLARGFYYAGAKNIITSLWGVDDKSTALIFSNFYSGLDGNNYTNALYNAKLSYLKSASAANASPYYWAAFVHIGYQKPATKNNWLLIAITFLSLALIASFIFFRRR